MQKNHLRTYGNSRRYITNSERIWAQLDDPDFQKNVDLYVLQESTERERVSTQIKDTSDRIASQTRRPLRLSVSKKKDRSGVPPKEPVVLIQTSSRRESRENRDKKKKRDEFYSKKKTETHAYVKAEKENLVLAGSRPRIAHFDIPVVQRCKTVSQSTSKRHVKLDDLLRFLHQDAALPFKSYIEPFQKWIRKIGEATYSEVYEVHTRRRLVWKIVPFLKKEQLRCIDLYNELRSTKTLGDLDGFVKMRRGVIVQGPYPRVLLRNWDMYKNKYGTQNYRPDYFDKDQYFCILQLEHGGIDLEHFTIYSWQEAWIVFSKVIHALAIAERRFEFEHRDLHWGNILVRRKQASTQQVIDLLGRVSLSNALDKTNSASTAAEGDIQITIIDYTLSRLRCTDGRILYYDFDDPEIFTAEGDYQFDIYRFMRDSIKLDWASFHPKTNVMWIHYLAYQLVHKKNLPIPKKDDESRENTFFKYFIKVLNVIRPGSNNSSRYKLNSAVSVERWISDGCHLPKTAEKKLLR
ncbi:haspin protein kinase [Schizosaccharomyces japonicus yFS275]|uniref:non-specific serine/threonine protein kinase n=1 Tax=Schizosaccharomyces japonicus (strain yFS275 / FY16936) TaxID=402676 RepID=B6JWA5_SCHJY|nr:haspin protein kinase [Schizosaccharomyces japonicus yFS275]EEB05656.1 haspin protein kinase [Schizosaccharomyces japonicus yFS275]